MSGWEVNEPDLAYRVDLLRKHRREHQDQVCVDCGGVFTQMWEPPHLRCGECRKPFEAAYGEMLEVTDDFFTMEAATRTDADERSAA